MVAGCKEDGAAGIRHLTAPGNLMAHPPIHPFDEEAIFAGIGGQQSAWPCLPYRLSHS